MNKKGYLIIAIFAIIFTFFGGTLAYWQWNTSDAQRTAVTFTINSLFKCAADGGGDITNEDVDLAPASCTNEKYAIQREVKVMPTITDPDALLSMDLWLDVNTIGSGLTNSQNFKYALTTEPDSCTNGVISTGTFNGKTANSTVQLLDGQTYAKTVNEKYYLYIWLDAAETSDSTMNQAFNLSLNGECTNNAQIETTDLSYTVTNLSANTNNLDTGFYTLSSYTCDNDSTTITYDTISKKITSTGIDKCDLNFTETSNPKLYDVVEIGDYIAYTADSSNGCTDNQCSGWNANQTATDIYDNYGYCGGNSNYKFYTYGWRVLHKTDNSIYIVSAGAPECVAGTSSNSTATIERLNTNALKYCNSSYLSGGICDSTTAHAFNGDDFYKFTGQYYGDANAKYLYSYNDGGTYGSPYCHNKYSTTYCGYNNSIIDNGGYYWFGSAYSASSTLHWAPIYHYVFSSSSFLAYGLRPVLKLDSSILATGGAGSIDNPYTISIRSGV